MADETNITSPAPSLSATAGQLATATGSMITSLIAAFGSVTTWPRVVSVAILALFVLVYFDKIHTPKLDNADVLAQVQNARYELDDIRKDIANLKALLTSSNGEMSTQLDRIEMQKFPEPAAPVAPKKSYKKPVAE